MYSVLIVITISHEFNFKTEEKSIKNIKNKVPQIFVYFKLENRVEQ